MTQLTEDVFSRSLMPLEEMERFIAEHIAPVVETETLSLAAAVGRVLATDLISPISLPLLDNSAVGLLEMPDNVILMVPGDQVDFLPYAMLMG
jgi:molybdopterin molybdotransferase